MSRACLLSVLLLGALAPVSAETVCLFYGSDEGATENVAEYIGIKTGLQAVPINLIMDHPAGPDLFNSCDHFIIGAPTLKSGEVQGKTGTAWDDFLPAKLKELGSLKGKKVAVFGTGDQNMYPFNFCDAMDELARAFADNGATLVGSWEPDTEEAEEEDRYFFEKSKALWPELKGAFVGLPLDEVNQQQLTGDRVREWLDKVRYEGMPLGHGSCEERRQLQVSAPLAARDTLVDTEMQWYSEWSKQLGCWFRALPVPSQDGIGACLGALGLHVASRFDAAFGGGAPRASAQPHSCKWLDGTSAELESFPAFPSKGSFEFRLPPIPRLVPRGAFQGMLSYEIPKQRYAFNNGGEVYPPQGMLSNEIPKQRYAFNNGGEVYPPQGILSNEIPKQRSNHGGQATYAETPSISRGTSSAAVAITGALAGAAASAVVVCAAVFGARVLSGGRSLARLALRRKGAEPSKATMSC